VTCLFSEHRLDERALGPARGVPSVPTAKKDHHRPHSEVCPVRGGYPRYMGSDDGGRERPEAGSVAGHLLVLVADRNYAALSAELSSLVQARQSWRHARAGRTLYGEVLTWLVTALADVVIARLGPAEEGESFVLEVRTTAGRTVGAGDLPPKQGRVGRSVLALLADDPNAARAHLAAAEREPDPTVRATTLVEALVWLDAMLDAETTAFPDLPP
jgi:hypothetical protein